MNNKENTEPIQNVSIGNIHRATAALYLKQLSKEEREAEDLNDKKAAWLMIVSKKPKYALTAREKRFIKEYEEQNIHFSMYYNFKPNIIQFIEEQKVKILGNK